MARKNTCAISSVQGIQDFVDFVSSIPEFAEGIKTDKMYDRLKAIVQENTPSQESVEFAKACATYQGRDGLTTVERLKELASDALSSYSLIGDFSQAAEYQRQKATERRMSITAPTLEKAHSPILNGWFGYYPGNWNSSSRAASMLLIATGMYEYPADEREQVYRELRQVATKEDCLTVAQIAKEAMKAFRKTGQFVVDNDILDKIQHPDHNYPHTFSYRKRF